MLLIPPLMYLTIVGGVTGYAWAGRLPRVYLACCMLCLVTNAWALVLCAFAPTPHVALLLAPGSIMPMVSRGV